jgi:hypothetical protein
MTSSRCSAAASPPPERSCAGRPSSSRARTPQPDSLSTRSARAAAGAFIAIALGAIAARFWALATQPGGLYPDEAAEGLSAQRLLHEQGYHPIFFDDDGGREVWFAYLVAVAFRWFGASVLVLRSTAAAVGVAGVIAVWLATRRFGRWPAMAAMAWAAGSLWLICVSRDGFRVILVPLVGAAVLAAMLRWGDRPGRGWALATGAAVGLGLWTYQPLKLAPLLVIAWLLWMRHADRARYLGVRAGAGWALLAYLAVAAPIFYTAVSDYNSYFGRGASVLLFSPESASVDSYPVHVLRTLGMFLVTGDPNARHDVNALPLLGPLLFIPFASGLWRVWRLRRDHAYAALLIGLVVFMIPPLVANAGTAPHFLRSLGIAPFVAALVGVGCLELLRLARALLGETGRHAAAAGITVLLASAGVVSIVTYLARPVHERYDAYSFAVVQLAAAANRGPGTVAIIDSYRAFDVRFLDWDQSPTLLAPGEHLRHPSVYSLIVSLDRNDIARATDSATAARAGVVARDAGGRPAVWDVVP